MLILQNFKKNYNNKLVLEIANLKIHSGIHLIKGINGSGKTTLFKCISGILYSEGDISLEGINLKKDPIRYRRLVSYSEAEPMYPSFLSGNDLIQFVSKARKADEKEINMLIQNLEISTFLHDPICTYSSGMIKKLSLVMGFIGKPKLIILDEPLVTIDKAAVNNMITLIKKYHSQYNCAFLISTHQDFAKTDLTIDSTYQVLNQSVNIIL